jgi:hypothetical protein
LPDVFFVNLVSTGLHFDAQFISSCERMDLKKSGKTKNVFRTKNNKRETILLCLTDDPIFGKVVYIVPSYFYPFR